MRTQQNKIGTFQKVGECLYRYSRNGVYYARIKRRGKETKCSLRTTDRVLAQRRLRGLRDDEQHIDPSRGSLTLAKLCGRWLATKQNGKPKTVAQKTYVGEKIKTGC